jgi:DNA-directed RNA polymerase subunit RPC12/RpoP
MGNRFAAGKRAISECDRCGQRFLLKLLKTEIIKTKKYDLLVCPECWDPDHPQLQLGMWPVDDPQALRNPRPDRSYVVSGTSGLQTDVNGGTTQSGTGTNEGGSRVFQWGWNPVGGSSFYDAPLTPNNLDLLVSIGTVTVSVT